VILQKGTCGLGIGIAIEIAIRYRKLFDFDTDSDSDFELNFLGSSVQNSAARRFCGKELPCFLAFLVVSEAIAKWLLLS